MSPLSQNEIFMSFCQKLVEAGGVIIEKAYREGISKYTVKTDHSHVTAIDREVENLYIAEITKEFPLHNIHGEESGDLDHHSDYTWYLDPLDGTSNFLFGLPLFGTMVALKYKSEIIASAINLPLLNNIFVAGKDNGAYLNKTKLVLPDRAISLGQATLLVDCGKSLEARKKYVEILTRLNTHIRSIRQLGCCAAHSSLLKSGHYQMSMIIDADSHDLFPSALIYQEAGYTLLNRDLKPWTVNDRDLISLHPHLTKGLIRLLKK